MVGVLIILSLLAAVIWLVRWYQKNGKAEQRLSNAKSESDRLDIIEKANDLEQESRTREHRLRQESTSRRTNANNRLVDAEDADDVLSTIEMAVGYEEVTREREQAVRETQNETQETQQENDE